MNAKIILKNGSLIAPDHLQEYDKYAEPTDIKNVIKYKIASTILSAILHL